MNVEAEEFEIQTKHFRYAAKRWGNPENPPFLGLHGWLDNASTFDYLAPLLSQIHLVAIDFLGHGLSDHRPPGEMYHFIDMVPEVIDVADVLGWDKFSLLGHSMGAGVSTLVAGTLPSRISKVVLIEGLGPLTDDPQNSPKLLSDSIRQMKAFENPSRPPTPLSYEQAIATRMKAGNLSEKATIPLVDRGTKKSGETFIWRSDSRLKITSRIRLTEEQVLAFIDGIEAPVLLLVSDSGYVPQRAKMQVRCEHVKQLTIHHVAGGHHLHLENPEPVAEIVTTWIL